jgi:branched-chain amino acid aminotransferase
VNGEWEQANQASVSIFDHGLLYGDGVFDSLMAQYGYIHKLDAHLDRFERSAKAIHLELPVTKKQLHDLVLECLQRNELDDAAYIKVIGTRGITKEPLLDPRGAKPTVIVFARPYLHWAAPEKVAAGLSAKLTSVRRVPFSAIDPRVKSLNYLNNILARIEAQRAGCDEALIVDDQGFVGEGPGFNVFVVRSGTVVTPEQGVLEGITRETVLELCDELGLPVRRGPVAPYDYAVAEEAFITSTAGGIMPITSVDGHKVGSGTLGPITRRLREAFDKLLRSGKGGTPIRQKAAVRS